MTALGVGFAGRVSGRFRDCRGVVAACAGAKPAGNMGVEVDS